MVFACWVLSNIHVLHEAFKPLHIRNDSFPQEVMGLAVRSTRIPTQSEENGLIVKQNLLAYMDERAAARGDIINRSGGFFRKMVDQEGNISFAPPFCAFSLHAHPQAPKGDNKVH